MALLLLGSRNLRTTQLQHFRRAKDEDRFAMNPIRQFPLLVTSTT
ncbi:MAG TPA: hypothetical protein VFD86_03455 [Nitrospira sp.]|nr:hypothetical protein [Nitrospira sp.]